MKRLWFLFFLLLTAPLSANDWHFAIEPRIGITYGSMGEYLYMEKSDGSWKKNSYLEWEEKPLATLGLSLSGAYNRFGMQTYLDGALPLQSGTMYDSDWKVDSQPDLMTTHSMHENHVKENILVGTSFWYDFRPDFRVTIAPVLSAEFAYQRFKAEDGEAWHGESNSSTNGENVAWSDAAAKYYRKGLVADIMYHRQTLYTFFGLKASFQTAPRIKTEFAVYLSPYAYLFSRDIHYGWNTETRTQYRKRYTVNIQHAHFSHFKGSAAVYYACTKRMELGAVITGLVGDPIKSDYYDENSDTGRIYQNKHYRGGFSVYEASLKLSAKVHLF